MKRRREESSKASSTNSNNGDVYSRVSTTNTAGRGSLSGWVTCPLCNVSSNKNPTSCNGDTSSSSCTQRNNSKSQKKFSLGRGLSMHLQQVHTPWKPGKAELSRRERIRRRIRGMVHGMFVEKTQHSGQNQGTDDVVNESGANRNTNKDAISDDDNKYLYYGNANDLNPNQFPPLHPNENEQEYYTRVLKHILGKLWNKSNKKDDNLTWAPTQDEIKAWDKKVLELSHLVEQNVKNVKKQLGHDQTSTDATSTNGEGESATNPPNNIIGSSSFIPAGHDRNGCKIQSYKESLPTFIKAASEGNLHRLQEMIQSCCNDSDKGKEREDILHLINVKDRNGSIADHWCAGNGHLDCLKYIMDLRCKYKQSNGISNDSAKKIRHENKKRKRDGKTCLHYAARNGHDHIIRHLLTCCEMESSSIMDVDMISNDSTTPLHLSCYGGHSSTINLLITTYKADLLKVNSWRCGIGHWLAMTVQKNNDEIAKCLDFIKDYTFQNPITIKEFMSKVGKIDESINLKERNIDKGHITTFHIFGIQQGQGHSAVHKACQKRNLFVVQWLMKEAQSNWNANQIATAGTKDVGGNKPHEIWTSMARPSGGVEDEQIVQEMKKFGW